MAVRKSGLGKGLDSLIPDHQSEKTGLHTESEESGSNDGVVMVKISKVEPNKNQPRKQFDEDSLLELADSIKLYGVLQPLLVLDKGNYYEIIGGLNTRKS